MHHHLIKKVVNKDVFDLRCEVQCVSLCVSIDDPSSAAQDDDYADPRCKPELECYYAPELQIRAPLLHTEQHLCRISKTWPLRLCRAEQEN